MVWRGLSRGYFIFSAPPFEIIADPTIRFYADWLIQSCTSFVFMFMLVMNVTVSTGMCDSYIAAMADELQQALAEYNEKKNVDSNDKSIMSRPYMDEIEFHNDIIECVLDLNKFNELFPFN